ncbi:MAG TPA: response regulator [Chloroflexi bacterium]|nr:response regulator [Chloroflexota bacterium]
MSDKQTRTILYVEDNPENRLLVRRILQAEGYQVIEAEHAHQALKIIEGLHPDLVLMDINMPDMDGFTLTAKFKEMPHLKDVPIVALTANVMRGDKERTLDAGCDGYIQKPIDVDALPLQLAAYLKHNGQ